MKATKEFVDKLIWSIENEPGRWYVDEYTVGIESPHPLSDCFARKERIQVWIANGYFAIYLYRPTKLKFRLIDKIRLRRAIKVLASKKLIEELNNNYTPKD